MARQTTGRPPNYRRSSGYNLSNAYAEGNKAVGSLRMAQNPAGTKDRLAGPQIIRPDGVVPYQVALPDVTLLKDIKDLSKLKGILDRYGVSQPWAGLELETAKYVQRISERTWTPDALKAEVESLVNSEATKGNRMMAKSIYQQASLREMMDGDDPSTVEFMRMGEGDPNQCDSCARLAGMVGTLAEHEAWGLWGGDSCDGGKECRCFPMRIY